MYGAGVGVKKTIQGISKQMLSHTKKIKNSGNVKNDKGGWGRKHYDL